MVELPGYTADCPFISDVRGAQPAGLPMRAACTAAAMPPDVPPKTTTSKDSLSLLVAPLHPKTEIKTNKHRNPLANQRFALS
jgi:hypothetical protein